MQKSRTLRQIKNRVYRDLSAVLRQINRDLAPSRSVDPVLGEVADIGSLVQRAQREGVAIWECSMRAKRKKNLVKESFLAIATRIIGECGKTLGIQLEAELDAEAR